MRTKMSGYTYYVYNKNNTKIYSNKEPFENRFIQFIDERMRYMFKWEIEWHLFSNTTFHEDYKCRHNAQ